MTTLFAGTAIPVGAVLPFAGPSTLVPEGYLLCNGAQINRNDFAALFDVIGTFWGHGNTTTTFNLPTTQGLLLRGVAYGSGNDPDRNTRNAVLAGGQTGDEVGSFQNWRVQSHGHYLRYAKVNGNGQVNGAVGANFGGNNNFNNITGGGHARLNTEESGVAFNGNLNSNNTSGLWGYRLLTQNAGGNQTIGQNVYMNFIIKY